ncbi:MAG: TolC family protein [Planctomycetes bacterium]|nr:TolC family protein [Planctomycetota bacterium]
MQAGTLGVVVLMVLATGAGNEAENSRDNGPITLRDALALAQARSPELAVFPYELRAAEARVLQAGLRPNPELQIEIEEFGGRGERRGFEGAETSVQIGLPIELAGKRAKRGRVAALDKDLVQWDYEAARLDVMREVGQAFASVLAAQERLALAERLLELSRQAQTAVAQRVQAGKDSPVDDLRANVALSESRIERQKAEKALIVARHRLAATWGDRTPRFKKGEGEFYTTAAPVPLEQLVASISDNPDLMRWRAEQERRQAALRLARAQGVPDITIGGGMQRFAQTDDTALVFGLSVPLPLFDRNQGGVLEATAELAKTQRQYEAAQVKTLAALAEAAGALAAAYDEVTILQNDVLPKAKQVFDAAQQGYLQGKFDYLYLLDAQRTLFQTQAQHADSVEAYHRAQAEVQRLIGRLPQVAFPQKESARAQP